MIVVKIELWSAITKKVSEIGRMYIANDGNGTRTHGDYKVAVCRRGSDVLPRTIAGNGPAPTRAGEVKNYPRLALNVWRLIARATVAAFPEERSIRGAFTEIDSSVMRGLAKIAHAHLETLAERTPKGATVESVLSEDEVDALMWLGAGASDQ